MSNKIYAALTYQFTLRMRNWAWTNSGGQVGYAMSHVYAMGVRGSYGQARTPLLTGEAEDTSRALAALPVRYRQAVSLFWQYEGRPLSWFALRSGTGVDYRTFEKRVMHGHELLRAELAKQAEQTKRYRAAARRMLNA